MFKGKNILLGVCGSIAAYKIASLIRLLIKEGANVKVIMTPGAITFITPLTFATLSKQPVFTEFSNSLTGEWNNHVELGLWADLFIIAPATANTIAKMSIGLCDNLLLATYLSAKCPVYFAPAMDLDMWRHKAVQENITKLKSFGNFLIPPGEGELASGLHGEGRMAEPEEILSFIAGQLKKKQTLSGKTILVTAGPTYEAIDPVRYIGNHSSGKMGFAIAAQLSSMGANVILVTGPTSLVIKETAVNRIDVTSAGEMLQACVKNFCKADACIMSAAVADYTPVTIEKQKIKKQGESLNIELKQTTDILARLGSLKTEKQILAGFALETNNEENNALKKLENKNLDFIVLNSLNDEGAGFAKDTNKITIIDRNKQVTRFELKDKNAVAFDICSKLANMLAQNFNLSELTV